MGCRTGSLGADRGSAGVEGMMQRSMRGLGEPVGWVGAPTEVPEGQLTAVGAEVTSEELIEEAEEVLMSKLAVAVAAAEVVIQMQEEHMERGVDCSPEVGAWMAQ